MGASSWVQVVAALEPESTITLSNSTAATSILSPQAIAQFTNGYFNKAGQTLRMRGQGRMTTRGTASDTLTLAWYMGAPGAAIGSETLIFSLGAINITSAALTNKPWWFDVEVTLKVNGSSATFEGMGIVGGSVFVATNGGVNASDSDTLVVVPQSNPTASTAFNALTALQWDLGATWSFASASNSLQLTKYTVESFGVPVAA